MATAEKIGELLRNMQGARAQGGPSIVVQLFEIGILMCAGRRFKLADYFDNRLYLKRDSIWNIRDRYIGYGMTTFLATKLNPVEVFGIAQDKLIAYTLLDASKVRIPRIYAVFSLLGRSFPGAQCINTSTALADFLRGCTNYPIFCKPNYGAHGHGALAIYNYDDSHDDIVTSNGRIRVSAFSEGIYERAVYARSGWAYLIQEQLVQEESLRKWIGERVSTIRVAVLVSNGKVEIFRAAWRIIAGENLMDHFSSGKSGNLLADIDIETGTIKRVVRGVGVKSMELRNHPDTGEMLIGKMVPYWSQVRRMCEIGAGVLGMIAWQHWDIAIGETGPIAVEVNTTGDPWMLQVASGEGIYDDRLSRFVRERALGRNAGARAMPGADF